MLNQWHHLLQPINCGPMHLKNRLTAAPINTGLENLPNLALLADFYSNTAADGVSLITVFSPAINWLAKQSETTVAACSDDFRRYKKIIDAVRGFDCRTALQLNHVGQDAKSIFPVSSMSGVSRHTGKTFHAAPSFLIRRIIRQFTHCAQKAVDVGFDAIEINASGRSFIASFLSPAVNRRQDTWGKNQLGRFRLLLEIVRSCKKTIGETKALGVRFNLIDFSPKGANWEEVLRLIQMLRIAGADYLIGVANGFDERVPTHSHAIPDGVWLSDYEDLAQASDLPVFFCDPSQDFGVLEEISKKHSNAVFSFSSALLGDKSFIRKKLGIIQGSIRPWIDHHDCGVPTDVLRTHRLLNLTDPLQFGHFPLSTIKSPRPKKIAVIGGGLAGMLFAKIAATRGHHVTLFEKSDALGGQIHFLCKVEKNNKYENWLKILTNELKINNVNVIYNKKINLREFKETQEFDRYIVATGSEPEIPDIAGINASNVVTYEELLNDTPVGNRVAVLGNGRIALFVSRFLLENKAEDQWSVQSWRNAWGIGSVKEHGGGVLGVVPEIDRALRQLYLIEHNPEITKKLLAKVHNRWDLTWLRMRGAQTVQNINIELIDNHAVRISDRPHRGNRQTIRVDHVVICAECTPNLEDRSGCLPTEDSVTVIGAASSQRGYMQLADIVRQAYEKASII